MRAQWDRMRARSAPKAEFGMCQPLPNKVNHGINTTHNLLLLSSNRVQRALVSMLKLEKSVPDSLVSATACRIWFTF